MSLFDSPFIQSILSKFKSDAKAIGSNAGVLDYAKAKDAFGKLVMAMVSQLVAALDGDKSTDGSDKKQFIKDTVGQLFDLLSASLVGLPWYAKAVWMVVAPYVRSYAVDNAGGLVEWALENIRADRLAVKVG